MLLQITSNATGFICNLVLYLLIPKSFNVTYLVVRMLVCFEIKLGRQVKSKTDKNRKHSNEVKF